MPAVGLLRSRALPIVGLADPMSKKPAWPVAETDALSRKRTADLLRRLRTLKQDVRMLKVQMDAAKDRELQTRLQRRRKRSQPGD